MWGFLQLAITKTMVKRYAHTNPKSRSLNPKTFRSKTIRSAGSVFAYPKTQAEWLRTEVGTRQAVPEK